MKDFEKAMEVAEHGNIETFIEKIKELPLYRVYENAVKEKKDKDTAKLLQMSVMLMSMGDNELSFLMTKASLDLLFAMADEKLKNDILGDENI